MKSLNRVSIIYLRLILNRELINNEWINELLMN